MIAVQADKETRGFPRLAKNQLTRVEMDEAGPVLRIFEVNTRPGRVAELLENFATTSAAVVAGRPGNRGYFFGRAIEGDGNAVMFVSVWESLDAVKAHFGEDWQQSYLPPGYEDLIADCSLRHIDMTSGWHLQDGP